MVGSRARRWGEQACLCPSLLPTCFLEEPQRSPAVGPLLPSFLFGFQRDVWAVCAAELGAGWAGGRKDICLLSCQGAGRGGGVGLEWGCCESVGASACGPLDTQLMTWRPLRGQLAQPPALVQDILGQTAEVSTITGPKSSPPRRTFSPCDSSTYPDEAQLRHL